MKARGGWERKQDKKKEGSATHDSTHYDYSNFLKDPNWVSFNEFIDDIVFHKKVFDRLSDFTLRESTQESKLK